MAGGRSARETSSVLRTRQRLPYIIAARVDGTGTASILEGSNDLTLVDTGVGDYLLTLKNGAAARVMTVVVTPIGAAGDIVATLGTVSATAVQILGWDATDGTTAKDMDFHVMIMVSDSGDGEI